MGRRKTSSQVYEKAFRRIAGCKSIDADFNFGNDLTAANYQAAIANLKSSMDEYNTMLSTVDEKLNSFKDNEFIVRDWNERILVAVAAKYGKWSSQYEQAGGRRRIERYKKQALLNADS